jgi:hypothetical protein
MRLGEIHTGLSLTGIEPAAVVSVVATVPLGEDALQLLYRTPSGVMQERMLGRADEDSITLDTAERPFSFDGDGTAFQLACEAKRIDLAFLFDPMMAVHTSNVEPLPHQITAAYESLLPRSTRFATSGMRSYRNCVQSKGSVMSLGARAMNTPAAITRTCTLNVGASPNWTSWFGGKGHSSGWPASVSWTH